MADTVSPQKRSEIMSRIRSSGNKTTEVRLATLMREAGLSGWSPQSILPGTPDFAFHGPRVCVFVHGCFWHGCPRHSKTPKTHTGFWQEKIANNRRRDRRVAAELRRLGYRVITIWECQLAGSKGGRAVGRVRHALEGR